jgi:hypothetical protein
MAGSTESGPATTTATPPNTVVRAQSYRMAVVVINKSDEDMWHRPSSYRDGGKVVKNKLDTSFQVDAGMTEYTFEADPGRFEPSSSFLNQKRPLVGVNYNSPSTTIRT